MRTARSQRGKKGRYPVALVSDRQNRVVRQRRAGQGLAVEGRGDDGPSSRARRRPATLPPTRSPPAAGRAIPSRRGRPWVQTGRRCPGRRATPAAPNASADRNSVPALPGSAMPASSSTAPVLGQNRLEVAGRGLGDRDRPGGRLEVREPCQRAFGQREHGRSAGFERPGQGRVRRQGRLGAVELLDRQAAAHALRPSSVGPSKTNRPRSRRACGLAQIADALDARVVRAERGRHRATFTAESSPPCRSVPAG